MVQEVLAVLEGDRISQLFMIKDSPGFVARLVGSVDQAHAASTRMAQAAKKTEVLTLLVF